MSRVPNIAHCLVLPFESPCTHGTREYPALVFAKRGDVVLFADEHARQFGVGTLDKVAGVMNAGHFATLDLAAEEFLSRATA